MLASDRSKVVASGGVSAVETADVSAGWQPLGLAATGGIMKGRKTSERERSRDERSSRRQEVRRSAIEYPPPIPVSPSEILRQRKYRNVVRKHLDQVLDRIFVEFTGLHFHISWAPSPPRAWAMQSLPTACSVCCQLSGSPLLTDCCVCGPRQLTRALGTGGGAAGKT